MDKSVELVIELNGLHFAYDEKTSVLEDINLKVRKGERIGIIGANGAGKSTLFKLLTGLLTGRGEVMIKGTKLEKKTLCEIRKRMGLVLQDSDNQLFMPTLFDDMAFGPRNYGKSKEETEIAVNKALGMLGIEELKYRSCMRMSGGEKRMAAIATILAMEPEIILMDEPSITLDPYNRRNLINNLNEMDQTLLIASHDLDMILETCERVILIDNAKITADGRAEDILSDKELLEQCHLELPLCFQQAMPYNRDSN